MSFNPANPVVSVRTWDKQFIKVKLLAFYPDWEKRAKYRGYAIIGVDARIEPYGFAIRAEESGTYLMVNELSLSDASRTALMQYSAAHGRNSIVIDKQAAKEETRLNWISPR